MNESKRSAGSATDGKNRAAAQARAGAAVAAAARAGAAVASAGVEVAAEEATTWGRDAMDDVAGDGSVDGDTPCLLGIEHRQPPKIE